MADNSPRAQPCVNLCDVTVILVFFFVQNRGMCGRPEGEATQTI